MRSFLLLLSILSTLYSGLFAQEVPAIANFDARAFLHQDQSPRPQVMLVGTFHFNYPNLDAHVTAAEDRVDVNTAARQAELQALIDYVARFRPTKIVVERRAGSTINELYRRYLTAGMDKPRTGEIYQLAFPLGKRFGLDSLVLGDAQSLSRSLYWHEDSLAYRPMLQEVFIDEVTTADTLMEHRYWALYDLEDKMEAQSSLLDNFQHMNDPDRIRIGHGHYIQYLNAQEPDALALNWYSRNLRIYYNIVRSITSPQDRVLVLFGAGHLGILTQQLESDPRYDLVRFGDLAE